jgi:hypothetical protein
MSWLDEVESIHRRGISTGLQNLQVTRLLAVARAADELQQCLAAAPQDGARYTRCLSALREALND